MKYTTNDLSKILDVSTNTIRRFEEKGYLRAERDDQNNYRQFNNSDVEKLMYVGKYRKIGFAHEDITKLLQGDIDNVFSLLTKKKEELDYQIARYQAISHMMKDDIILIKNMRKYGNNFIERNCSPVCYILFMKKGEVCLENQREQELRGFMSSCPEFEYVYLFEKSDVEKNQCIYSEGVAAHHICIQKYRVDITPLMESYESRPCILRFVRLPLDITKKETNEEKVRNEQMQTLLFGGLHEYMEEHDYILAGDALGVKIGFSKEENREWQYVLMHFPVEKKNFV